MTASKIVAAAASSVGGGITDVDDVFSTFLYDGASNLVITNGIDLAGKGGLVWGKGRSNVDGHWLVDSERGKGSNNNFKYLRSEGSQAEQDISNRSLSSFNSNGFTFQGADAQFNASGQEYVTWTFRKAPKFFDIQTWTGNGVNGRTISHNLGSTPGMIIVKKTNAVESWPVYHRGLHASDPEDYAMFLNLTGGKSTETYWNNTAPTNTGFTVSSNSKLNSNAQSYIAYIFAHNDSGDGEFGPDSDQDVIKCGSYTGNGSSTGPVIDLGFEPQWLMVKRTDDSGKDWNVYDEMRGLFGTNSREINWNLSNAEQYRGMLSTSTGFQPLATSHQINASGGNYIYMAIRKGPLAAPTDATKVFHVHHSGSSNIAEITTGFPVDFAINRQTNNSTPNYAITRLTDKTYLQTESTVASAQAANTDWFSSNTSINIVTSWWVGSNYVLNYSWKRAPGYFDVVAYTGTGSASQSINHNLGVTPEMIWVKDRGNDANWSIYHSTLGISYVINFDTGVGGTGSQYWGTAAHTSSIFKVGSDTDTGGSGRNYIAYLFATAPGVSKVGSFVSDGNPQNIDCGFSSGARFVLIKKSSGTFNWRVWDSVRGIVAGDDPYIFLDTTGASTTNGDWIDPHSSGFSITTAFSNGTYIFYAIA